MTEQTPGGAVFDKESIIDGYTLSFDPGDKLNGSLYLGTSRAQESAVDHAGIIASLREAGLWSDTDPRQIADEQREAYKAGLEFVAAIRFATDEGEFIVTRFDNPQYPSSEPRWLAWLECLDGHFGRA